MSSTETESNEQPTTRTHKFNERIKRAPWRYNDDGTYNKRPTDDSYYRTYYKEHTCQRIQCEVCGADVIKHNIRQHQKSMKCTSIALKNKV